MFLKALVSYFHLVGISLGSARRDTCSVMLLVRQQTAFRTQVRTIFWWSLWIKSRQPTCLSKKGELGHFPPSVWIPGKVTCAQDSVTGFARQYLTRHFLHTSETCSDLETCKCSFPDCSLNPPKGFLNKIYLRDRTLMQVHLSTLSEPAGLNTSFIGRN